MRVNSALKGFFNNRLTVGSSVALVPIASRWLSGGMLAILFVCSSFTNHPDRDLLEKQVNLMIRQIGHRLLLQAGDSTSRVLPVTETNEGTFLLRFENEFVFNHDSLMVLSQDLFPETEFPSGYTVTVHECTTARIVYGFQVNNGSPDILPCRGRRQPPGCYTIEFAFADLYENVAQKKEEQKKATADRLIKEVKPSKEVVTPSKVHPRPQEATPPAEPKTTTFNNDIDRLTAELRSLKPAPKKADRVPVETEESKTAIFDYPFIILVCSGMLAFLSVGLLIGRLGKRLIPVPVQNQDHAITKESVPELAALGKFSFDVKNQRLLLGSEVISLTDKECRILELLNNNFGELIPRETLMQKIWIDEGVITGRSLDMFVSKLRKKLCSDPELRITNVHGKGYKLEIAGISN